MESEEVQSLDKLTKNDCEIRESMLSGDHARNLLQGEKISRP